MQMLQPWRHPSVEQTMMLRTVAERLSRKVILKRRLPKRVGGQSIFVSPDASLKLWRRNLEKTDPRLFDWAQEFVRKGDVVWDVGANVGLFTFAAASVAGATGYVLAIEADSWLVELLRKSVKTRPESSAACEVLSAAVSDSVDITRFHIAARGRSTNHLAAVTGSTQTGGVRDSVLVGTVSLDWLLEKLPAPQVLKIDVEGAEYQVLQGAHSLLSAIRPTILCEVTSESAERVGDLLKAHGYEMFDLDVHKDKRKPLASPTFNTLACLPASAKRLDPMIRLA